MTGGPAPRRRCGHGQRNTGKEPFDVRRTNPHGGKPDTASGDRIARGATLSSQLTHSDHSAPVSLETFSQAGAAGSLEGLRRFISRALENDQKSWDLRIGLAATMSRAEDPNGFRWFSKSEQLRAALGYGSVNQGDAPLKATLNFNPLARAQLEELLADPLLSYPAVEYVARVALQLTAPAHVELRLRIVDKFMEGPD
jgi:hypothetical protein